MGRKLTLTQEYIRDLSILVIIALGIFLFIKIKAWTAETTTVKLTSSGEERSYDLYIPKHYNRSKPASLVISLHGYSSKPSDMIYTTRWNDLADSEGFIAVYPLAHGSPTYWRTTGTTYASESAQMDVQFISDIITQLEKTYTIDPARIYVNGMSNGGGMTIVLACHLADRLAAVGSVAGAYSYPSDLCTPSRPIPLIAFHGTTDPTIPYAGGMAFGFNYPSVTQFMKNWAAANQCSENGSSLQEGEISSVSYTKCAQNADVVLYTINGGGHTWPGDQPSPTESVWGYTSQQIDATQLMWQFFEQHPLPASK